MAGLILFFFLSFFQIFPDNKKFVIDICSYNNKDWYECNLSSVFAQEYEDYRIVYTDDCSSDGTGLLVEQYVKACGKSEKIKIIHNDKRCRMLANHWRVIHNECEGDEIIIHLDGDDSFAHPHVLTILNSVYQEDDVWMTYGSYAFWPHNKRYEIGQIPQKVIDMKTYRKSAFRKSPYHPRTFYAWLAKQIDLEDLLFPYRPFEGQFIPAISDWSLLYPMFEMSGGRFKYIPDVLYNFNVINPLNHDKNKKSLRLQKQCAAFICRKKPYSVLNRPILGKELPEGCDILVYSNDELRTEELISSIKNLFKGYSNIFVIKDNGPLNMPLSEYVVCLSDDIRIMKKVDLQEAAYMLQKTRARAFYLFLPKKPRSLVWLENDVYAYTFASEFGYHHKTCAFLCKSTLIKNNTKDCYERILVSSEERGKICLVHSKPRVACINES